MARAHITTNRWDKDQLDAGSGYAASGESQWSRQSSTPQTRPKPTDADDEQGLLILSQRIAIQVRELGKLEAKLTFVRNGGDASRAAYLEKQHGIKLRFLERLQKEYRSGRRI
jgi:hypothetical protein